MSFAQLNLIGKKTEQKNTKTTFSVNLSKHTFIFTAPHELTATHNHTQPLFHGKQEQPTFDLYHLASLENTEPGIDQHSTCPDTQHCPTSHYHPTPPPYWPHSPCTPHISSYLMPASQLLHCRSINITALTLSLEHRF
ncbi:hypothetical protein AMECASPLE_016758 [Ameca splendens]|uniref:Uncharacterized protein n=1 Tax=Ameca splendens TaxID=208324 RepID=A0ABV0ZCY5_9TELE